MSNKITIQGVTGASDLTFAKAVVIYVTVFFKNIIAYNL